VRLGRLGEGNKKWNAKGVRGYGLRISGWFLKSKKSGLVIHMLGNAAGAAGFVETFG